ncbi:MAG: hypothetical protein ACXAEU_26225 [Candidatus Hodarchaeales archaeon]
MKNVTEVIHIFIAMLSGSLKALLGNDDTMTGPRDSSQVTAIPIMSTGSFTWFIDVFNSKVACILELDLDQYGEIQQVLNLAVLEISFTLISIRLKDLPICEILILEGIFEK